MSGLLKRLLTNRKIEIFVDDFDHKTKMANDHIFTRYTDGLLTELIYNYYKIYFSNQARLNLDRLMDSIPRTLIVGQLFKGAELSYVDSMVRFSGNFEDFKNYQFIVFVNSAEAYLQNGLEYFLAHRFRAAEVQELNICSIQSKDNYKKESYQMYAERYSARYVSSIGSTKNTPHIELKSKSGDRFNIPYGPFPVVKDWIKYELE